MRCPGKPLEVERRNGHTALGRERLELRDELLAGQLDGAPTHDDGAAVERSKALRHEPGRAVVHGDRRERHAERVGEDLRERGLVALPGRRRTGVEIETAFAARDDVDRPRNREIVRPAALSFARSIPVSIPSPWSR